MSIKNEKHCNICPWISSFVTMSLSVDGATRPYKLKALCADFLRYGAKAQIYKSYRTDMLADSAMTEEHKAYLSDIDAVTFGYNDLILDDLPDAPITWVGKTLSTVLAALGGAGYSSCNKMVFKPFYQETVL